MSESESHLPSSVELVAPEVELPLDLCPNVDRPKKNCWGESYQQFMRRIEDGGLKGQWDAEWSRLRSAGVHWNWSWMLGSYRFPLDRPGVVLPAFQITPAMTAKNKAFALELVEQERFIDGLVSAAEGKKASRQEELDFVGRCIGYRWDQIVAEEVPSVTAINLLRMARQDPKAFFKDFYKEQAKAERVASKHRFSDDVAEHDSFIEDALRAAVVSEGD